jgi:hypothetical protein
MLDEHTEVPTGITVDKMVELMHRAHEPFTITSSPWSRAYQLALQTEDTCVFSTSRTREREALFTWIGPLEKSDWAVLARANHTWKPLSLRWAIEPNNIFFVQRFEIGIGGPNTQVDFLFRAVDLEAVAIQ